MSAAPRAPIHIRVPGSTSNLGPGFDVLGMAVQRWLEVTFEGAAEPGPLQVVRGGTLKDLEVTPDQDLVVMATREHLARPLSGVLRMTSEIPVGRGLGSSASARVAGAILGTLLSGDAPDRETIALASARAEGHPDNAVPAVMGGLVAARIHPDGLEWTPLGVAPDLAFVYAAPETPLATDAARQALPPRVSHAHAVENAGRLPLLVAALARGDGVAVGRNLHDVLHVPYRIRLIPGAAAAVAAGIAAGAFGVTLSGAGSGLVAVAPPDRSPAVGEAMAKAFRAATGSAVAFPLRPDTQGARWG